MSERFSVAAVVLAAGQGSRMGGGKLLLPVGEKTVIERTVMTLLEGGVSEVIVVTGSYTLAVQRALQAYPVRFAFNPHLASEMIDSFQIGLREIEPGRVHAFLMALGDQPLIRPETVSLLLSEFLGQREKMIAVPIYRGRWGHPVVFHVRLYETALTFRSEEGLRPLVRGKPEGVLRVPVNDEGVIMDLDSWDDYRKVLCLWMRRRYAVTEEESQCVRLLGGGGREL